MSQQPPVPVSVAASGLEGETTAIDVGAATGLLATISQLRVVAGDHRQLAETILARLVGNRGVVDSSPRLRPRVLVVDDSDTSRETTATILEEAGFDAMTANNGLEAVIVAYYARPSVVLMDVTMPVLDGLEAARLIKASPVTRDMKVIAYTATADVFETPWTAMVCRRDSQARESRGDRLVGSAVCGDSNLSAAAAPIYIKARTCQSEEFISAWYSAGETDRFEYRQAMTNMFFV